MWLKTRYVPTAVTAELVPISESYIVVLSRHLLKAYVYRYPLSWLC